MKPKLLKNKSKTKSETQCLPKGQETYRSLDNIHHTLQWCRFILNIARDLVYAIQLRLACFTPTFGQFLPPFLALLYHTAQTHSCGRECRRPTHLLPKPFVCKGAASEKNTELKGAGSPKKGLPSILNCESRKVTQAEFKNKSRQLELIGPL